MLVKVATRKGKQRIVESATGRIARSTKGRPMDGGGHDKDHDKAVRQMRHVNEAVDEKRRKEMMKGRPMGIMAHSRMGK